MARAKSSSNSESNKPVVTSLPIAAGDSPLVIDLPDGQKLVVGKMESGTVIEVATWRGTGRPDSRTNRLMLGVSSTEELNEQSTKDEAGSATENTDASKLELVKMVLQTLLGKIAKLAKGRKKNSQDSLADDQSKSFEKSSNYEPLNSSSSSYESDLDIDEFFESLKRNNYSSSFDEIEDAAPKKEIKDSAKPALKRKGRSATQKGSTRRKSTR